MFEHIHPKVFTTPVAEQNTDEFNLELVTGRPIDWTNKDYLAKVERFTLIQKSNSLVNKDYPRMVLSIIANDLVSDGIFESISEAFAYALKDISDSYASWGAKRTAYEFGFGKKHDFLWLTENEHYEIELILGKDKKMYKAPFHIKLAPGRKRLTRRYVKKVVNIRPIRLSGLY